MKVIGSMVTVSKLGFIYNYEYCKYKRIQVGYNFDREPAALSTYAAKIPLSLNFQYSKGFSKHFVTLYPLDLTVTANKYGQQA